MHLSYDFNVLTTFTPEVFHSLSEILSPEISEQCLKESGIATLRKRRLPLEMMVWSIIGMSFLDTLR